MEKRKDKIEDLLFEGLNKVKIKEKFKALGLTHNPFPRAGISDLNSSNNIVSKLRPLHQNTEDSIREYILDSLSQDGNEKNRYISLVIRGDYGSGKTQTILYLRYLLENLRVKNSAIQPYVVYIDNPGAKLSELVGSIISQIGEENFKKYLWDVTLNGMQTDEEFRNKLKNIVGNTLFTEDIYNNANLISHKGFLNSLIRGLTLNQRRLVEDLLKVEIIKIFTLKFSSSTIANYFYALSSEDIGVNKIWEILSSGGAKDLDKKEVFIIRAIVDLIELNGYTDFYILVDEFEDVTAGRLSSPEIDRYITNLRSLIDKERNWCSVFSMTGLALEKLKNYSPPLYDRISSRVIDLKSLDNEAATKIILNYLNLARDYSESIYPFDINGINEILEKSIGNLRLFLKICFNLLQRISEDDTVKVITADIVKKYISNIGG